MQRQLRRVTMNLNISILFVELAFVFMPGFIWMKIQKSFGPHGDYSQFDMVLNSFIFGVASYAVLGLLYWSQNWVLHITSVDPEGKK